MDGLDFGDPAIAGMGLKSIFAEPGGGVKTNTLSEKAGGERLGLL